MMIAQEGMEATQKRMNMLLRLGCHFANVGRIPIRVLRAGRHAVKDYLLQRKKKKASPEEWLWQKNFSSFCAKNEDILARVEGHRSEGRTMDWKTEYEVEKVSFVRISTIYRILLARARFNVAFFQTPPPRHTGAIEDPRLRVARGETTSRCAGERRRERRPFEARTISFRRSEEPVRKDMVGHNFKVTVYDEWRACLVTELAAYYAPVPCESEATFALRDERTQRRDIQAQRKARWQKRVRSELWVAQSYTPNTQ